jgi:phage FluMu protein Com
MQRAAALGKTTAQPSRPEHGAREAATRDLRCDCGKLLARVVRSVLELKCSRCKRVVLVVEGRRFEARGAPSCSCDAEPSSLA